MPMHQDMDSEWAVTNRFIPVFELERFSLGEGVADDLEPAILLSCELRGGTTIDICFRRTATEDLHRLLSEMIHAWST